MVNPFDLRTIFLAKHAQHVVLIHFPIALFMIGVLFDLLSRGKRDSQLATAAYLNFSVAAVAVFPTCVTGVLAWQFVLEGAKLKGLILLHFVEAISSGRLGRRENEISGERHHIRSRSHHSSTASFIQ